MIAWFARNHVAANLLLACIVLTGLYSLSQRLPLEIFPEFDIDIINISVFQRAAAPEDMEQGVASRVEEEIADLSYIKKLSSRSSEQSALITVELFSGSDAQAALNEIKSRVDSLSTLPVEAERPRIELALRKREVLSLVVSGELDEKELSRVTRRVRDELTQLKGITQTDIEGLRPYEITINIDQDTLRQHQLSLQSVGQAIQSQSIDLSAGQIKSLSGEIRVRSKAQAYNYTEYADIVLKRYADGSSLKLGDIAVIDDSFEEAPIITRYNSKLAAVVNVYRTGSESAISVSDAVQAYLPGLRASLPNSVSIDIWDDDSRIVRARLSTLFNSAWQGGLLVILLLSCFLRPTIALWVVVGIPVSFMGALVLMPWLGVTINLVSLFAFILVLGIVVDDAIVTAENIYTHHQSNPKQSGLMAAINGTKEVSVPVTFGVLTTICAFLPFTMISGRMGAIYEQIAFVVMPVLVFSLIESKLILPAHLKHLKRPKAGDSNRLTALQENIAQGLQTFVVRYYQPVLKRCMLRPYITSLIFVAMTAVSIALVTSGWTRFVSFPRIPSESARVSLAMQTGTAMNITEEVIKRIENAAVALKDKYRDSEGNEGIRNILSTIGASGGDASGQSNVGSVRFEITPPQERIITINPTQLIKEWRSAIGPVAGVESMNFRAEIGRSSDPIDIQLTAPDYQSLQLLVEGVREKLSEYEGVFDISDSLSDGKQELLIELKPQAEILGLTLASVTNQVRQALDGYQAQRIQRGQDDVRVMVRYPAEQRRSSSDLNELRLLTPTSEEVRFADVADYRYARGPAAIYHVERQRAVNVVADIDKQRVNLPNLNAEIKAWLAEATKSNPSVNYTLEGEAREQSDTFSELRIGLGIVLLSIFTLLAIPLRSYAQPLIVMSIIPFSFVGALVGHGLMGHDISMMSMMGMMALVGIVVNDSLVLVDYINQKIKTGASIQDAVYQAGGARFRPVLLTSLTTFVGLLPLLFEKTTQAQFLIPMAISLGFGILFATMVTLVLVPCHYLIMDGWRRFLGFEHPYQLEGE